MALAGLLAEITSRTLEVFPSAEAIILFGSRARGAATPDSDLDLLVVTPTSLRPAKRSARLRQALRGLDTSFDLIVITPEESAGLRGLASGVVARALTEGTVLHAAA
jgi:predicted nucleotidyltransferase